MTKTKNLYASLATTTQGGKYQPFKKNSLPNLYLKGTSKYAETDLIQGKTKTPNRPGTITLSNFKVGLPTGSRVTKVTVYYTHAKVKSGGKVCNIPAPKISLMNGNSVIKYNKSGKNAIKTVKAPTEKVVKNSISFTSSWDYSLFNSKDFGVKIDYPTNANNDSGFMRVHEVYIVLEYASPSFEVKITPAKGNTGYNGDSYKVQVDLSNKNNTVYIPTLTITCPPGFSLTDSSKVTRIDNRTFKWKPSTLKPKSTANLLLNFDVNVTFPSGSPGLPCEFVVSEDYSSKYNRFNAVITPKPPEPKTITPDPPSKPIIPDDYADPYEPEIITIPINQDIDFDLEMSTGSFTLYCCTVTNGEFENWNLNNLSNIIKTRTGDTWRFDTQGSVTFYNDDDHGYMLTEKGAYTLVITATGSTTPVKVMYVDVKVNGELTTAVLQLSQEELNRMGHGYVYRLQSLMKIMSSEAYVRDWGRNFKIGVFNNPVADNIQVWKRPNPESESGYDEIVVDSTDYDSLTLNDIISGAEYWSNPLKNTGEYANVELKFPYNKNYPFYILIGGDYSTAGTVRSNIKFIEPCIIEDDYYDGRETNGVYPVPIDNTVLSSGDFAELNIESLSTSTMLIYYDLPLDEDYGTNELMAIRGLQVNGVIQQNTDDLTIYIKLKSPTGESRVRSINLDALDTTMNSDNTFSIGGIGDLWGMSTLDIVNLEDWEIELLVDNTINNNTGTINYADVSLTIYVAEVNPQNVKCFINDEDLSYYGAFITDVEIPEGLKTDVDFLTIEGTDTNYPHRQNVREKEITITLDIGEGCDIEGNTISLRDLARLFTNKRDKYNHPIPNRIEFSHYPDVYWEYIMESPFDNSLNINTYEVKIKLTVPSGTAYKKTATSTNSMGYVNGLVNVAPVIVIKPTDSLITITETLTEQNFHMGYPNDITDKVIVIDCEDRICWLKDDEDDEDGENISAYVDFNSDWFSIIEEYQFETVGCVIKEVSYIERW